MKRKFKLEATQRVAAIQRIAKVIALCAVIAFSFAACGGDDGGDDDSGNKILGLPYSLKFEHTDNFGGELITYILDCSYKEAYEILTQQLGQWNQQCGGQGGIRDFPGNIAYLDYMAAHPNYVNFQDCVDFGQYRLVTDTGTEGIIDGTTMNVGIQDGRSWVKRFDQEGRLRVTNIPAKYEKEPAGFEMLDYLNNKFIVQNVYGPTPPYGGTDLSWISNGSVDIPLWWFPSKKKYDRSGTYNLSERCRIYFWITTGEDSSDVFTFPTVTFTNSNAELDFSKATMIPNPFR